MCKIYCHHSLKTSQEIHAVFSVHTDSSLHSILDSSRAPGLAGSQDPRSFTILRPCCYQHIHHSESRWRNATPKRWRFVRGHDKPRLMGVVPPNIQRMVKVVLGRPIFRGEPLVSGSLTPLTPWQFWSHKIISALEVYSKTIRKYYFFQDEIH